MMVSLLTAVSRWCLHSPLIRDGVLSRHWFVMVSSLTANSWWCLHLPLIRDGVFIRRWLVMVSSLATAVRLSACLCCVHLMFYWDLLVSAQHTTTAAHSTVATVCCKAIFPLELLWIFHVGSTAQNYFHKKVFSVHASEKFYIDRILRALYNCSKNYTLCRVIVSKLSWMVCHRIVWVEKSASLVWLLNVCCHSGIHTSSARAWMHMRMVPKCSAMPHIIMWLPLMNFGHILSVFSCSHNCRWTWIKI